MTFDFSSLGSTFSVFVIGLLNALATALENTDWFMVSKVGQFLASLDWKTILAEVGRIIIDAISAGIKLYAGLVEAAPIETALITAILGFKFAGIGIGIAKKIGESLAKPRYHYQDYSLY